MPKYNEVEEALDYCLQNPGNLSVNELLDKFPEYQEQIEPLLVLAANLNTIQTPYIPLERRAAMKGRLLAASERRNAARQATTPLPVIIPPIKHAPRRKALGWLTLWQRTAWASGTAIALALVFVWWAAAHSLPDSPFYDVKLSSERLVVDFTPNAAARLRAHIDMANARLDDTKTMVSQGKLDKTGKALDNYSEHIVGSLAALNEVKDSALSELAKLVYTSTAAGSRMFGVLKSEPGLPASIKKDIEKTLETANNTNEKVAQALVSAGISPTTLPMPSVELVIPTSPSGTQVVAMVTATQIQVQALQHTGSTVLAPANTSTDAAISLQASATSANSKPAGAGNPQTKTVATSVTVATSSGPRTSTLPTATGVRSLLVSPTAAHIPPVTSTVKVAPPTVPPTYTRVRVPSSTNTRVTRRPTSSPARPSHTPLPPVRTSTQVATPVPHSSTVPPAPTSTSILSSSTPIPPLPTANICNLDVTSVGASCNAASCVNWTAQVNNNGPSPIQAAWTAELLTHEGGGGFHTVSTMHGATDFALGETSVADSFCYDFSSDTNNYKIRFSVDSDGSACTPEKTTGANRRCEVPASTVTPRPTQPPTNTHEPRNTHEPENTPEPTNTRQPTNTREPHHTPHPTHAPDVVSG